MIAAIIAFGLVFTGGHSAGQASALPMQNSALEVVQLLDHLVNHSEGVINPPSQETINRVREQLILVASSQVIQEEL
jgi:hypothetical protein